MPRISSIFEGFNPPPTPGASLTQYEHRQKPQAKADKEKPTDELQLQKSLATSADNAAGGVGDLNEHRDTTDDTPGSFRNPIDKESVYDTEDQAQELEDEGSSSEVGEADMSSEEWVIAAFKHFCGHCYTSY
jgi:hypothetical protein